jgi:hypothetical protein
MLTCFDFIDDSLMMLHAATMTACHLGNTHIGASGRPPRYMWQSAVPSAGPSLTAQHALAAPTGPVHSTKHSRPVMQLVLMCTAQAALFGALNTVAICCINRYTTQSGNKHSLSHTQPTKTRQAHPPGINIYSLLAVTNRFTQYHTLFPCFSAQCDQLPQQQGPPSTELDTTAHSLRHLGHRLNPQPQKHSDAGCIRANLPSSKSCQHS